VDVDLRYSCWASLIRMMFFLSTRPTPWRACAAWLALFSHCLVLGCFYQLWLALALGYSGSRPPDDPAALQLQSDGA
jgi:hypothetical protein